MNLLYSAFTDKGKETEGSLLDTGKEDNRLDKGFRDNRVGNFQDIQGKVVDRSGRTGKLGRNG